MSPHFKTFLRAMVHSGWHPAFWRIGARAHDPEPDRSTPQCRVVDHTQDFRRRFSKTTANHRQPSQTSHTS